MENKKPQGDFFEYIDIEAINNKLHNIKKAKYLPVTKAPSRASRAVKNGSVLFSLVRPYLKNIALVNACYSHCIASTGFYICNTNGLLLPEYMFYLMISDYVVYGLNQYMKGDNSPSINKENIESWLYPIPPLLRSNTASLPSLYHDRTKQMTSCKEELDFTTDTDDIQKHLFLNIFWEGRFYVAPRRHLRHVLTASRKVASTPLLPCRLGPIATYRTA